jgi:hypothetical protein
LGNKILNKRGFQVQTVVFKDVEKAIRVRSAELEGLTQESETYLAEIKSGMMSL